MVIVVAPIACRRARDAGRRCRNPSSWSTVVVVAPIACRRARCCWTEGHQDGMI